MLHNQTKFGNKIFCGTDDIIRTNIHWHSEPSLWPWSWCNNLSPDVILCGWLGLKHQLTNKNAITFSFFFHRTLQLMMLCYQTKFGVKWSSSLEEIAEIVIFWIYKPSLLPWHWRQWTNFSAWHSGLWCCIIISSLITNWYGYKNRGNGKNCRQLNNSYNIEAIIIIIIKVWDRNKKAWIIIST